MTTLTKNELDMSSGYSIDDINKVKSPYLRLHVLALNVKRVLVYHVESGLDSPGEMPEGIFLLLHEGGNSDFIIEIIVCHIDTHIVVP